MTAATLGVPLDDFRTWICCTRRRMPSSSRRTTGSGRTCANAWRSSWPGCSTRRAASRPTASARVHRRLREAKDNPLAAFLTPEQRRLFEETQRVMSLLEGFSDWVMDEVGAQVVPNVSQIRERFEARRTQRRGAVRPGRRAPDRARSQARAVPARRAVRGGVAAAGGQRAIDACCGRARGRCPSERELADPAAWVATRRATHAVCRAA